MRLQIWKLWWFSCGMLLGFASLSLAMGAVQPLGRVTDDTAIYQKLSDIQVKREMEQDFDSDIERLSKLEKRFQEDLDPNPLKKPSQRITQRKYRAR